jgi:hypothetical protein
VTADELVFQNGDKLTGTLVRLGDGKVTFKSSVLGEVTVAIAQIRSVSTDHPVLVVLPDRSVVNQPVTAGEPGHVRIGGSDFALTDLRSINPPKLRWTGKASLGFSLTESTKNETKLSLLLSLLRAGAKNRIAIDAGYLYARSEGETTADNWFINGNYNFAHHGRFYATTNASIQQDHVQHLDLRTILGGGIGYIVTDKPSFSFKTEGGLAWKREEFSTTGTTDDITLRLGYLLEKALWKSARLKHDFTIYPSFSDFSDYYFLAQIALEQALSHSMTVEARYIVDYDSTPAPDTNKSSTKVIVAVGKTF